MAVWYVKTAPAAEPFTYPEMKVWLNVPTSVTSQDALITSLIKEARMFVERHTSRALITQTISEFWDKFPVASGRLEAGSLDGRILNLHIAPVQSMENDNSLAYVAQDGNPSSYTSWANASNAKFFLDIISGASDIGPARICKRAGVDWPTIEPYTNAVRADYVAGYGTAASSVPAPLLTAIRRLVGAWYYGRKGTVKEDFGLVADLLQPYRVHK